MKRKKIIIGSRGSKLALIYAERVKSQLIKVFDYLNDQNVELKIIKTTGDINQKDRLSDIGGKGLFSKQIENELKEEKIDIGVHALKDMPSLETEGLITNCFLERNDPREVLISYNNKLFKDLNSGAIIGTSSYRREFQLKHIRNDLNFKLIRGNVDTRLKKLNDKLFDAIILSYAGIKSLNLDKNITQIFPIKEILPSVGQGTIALQRRIGDLEIEKLLNKINHKKTYLCSITEREFLKTLGGDCETAVGALADLKNNKIKLQAELFSLDGKKKYYYEADKDMNFGIELGKEVGNILIKDLKGLYKL